METRKNDAAAVVQLCCPGATWNNGRFSAGTLSVAVLAVFIVIINFYYTLPLGYNETMQTMYTETNRSRGAPPPPAMMGSSMPRIPVKTSLSDDERNQIKV
ncbi:hypothetical protein SK128_016038 [Halocaridina rubra]|uniref:Uncharacterized protein n=1 Tax=Halocaridina rubra TaxID=373956 RepID=A0AAN8XCK5_HALRR